MAIVEVSTHAPVSVQSWRQIPPEIFRRWMPLSRHIALHHISQRPASPATVSQAPDNVSDGHRTAFPSARKRTILHQ
jgi:hypothetical protein